MMPRLSAALVLLAAACCSTSRPPAGVPDRAAPEPPESVDAMPAQTSTSDFVPGPALTPSGPLLAWLEQQGPDQKLRLPVVITFANPGRFSIGSAHIGVAAEPPPGDAIRLKLDGTGLSVSLVEQVRARCSDKTQMTCVLWLDGLWGARAPALPTAGGDGDRHPFAVIAVGDVVDPANASTAFAAR